MNRHRRNISFHHTTANAWTATLTTTRITTHYITYQCIPTRTNTAQTHHISFEHLFISSTDEGPLHSKWHEGLAQEYLGNCFLHDANMFAPTGNEPRCMHSDPQGKSGPCVQREPTGRAIIVIVIVVEERERKRERQRERQGQREETERRGEERRGERVDMSVGQLYRPQKLLLHDHSCSPLAKKKVGDCRDWH